MLDQDVNAAMNRGIQRLKNQANIIQPNQGLSGLSMSS